MPSSLKDALAKAVERKQRDYGEGFSPGKAYQNVGGGYDPGIFPESYYKWKNAQAEIDQMLAEQKQAQAEQAARMEQIRATGSMAPPEWNYKTSKTGMQGEDLPPGAIGWLPTGEPQYSLSPEAPFLSMKKKMSIVGPIPYDIETNVFDGISNWWQDFKDRMSAPITKEKPEVIREEAEPVKYYGVPLEGQTAEKVNLGATAGSYFRGLKTGSFGSPLAYGSRFLGEVLRTGSEVIYDVFAKGTEKAFGTYRDFIDETQGRPIPGEGIPFWSIVRDQPATTTSRWIADSFFRQETPEGITVGIKQGGPLDRAWQASRIFYTSAIDYGVTEKFKLRYIAGEDPYALELELQSPAAELIGRLVFDPLNVMGPMIRVLGMGSTLDDVFNASRAGKAVLKGRDARRASWVWDELGVLSDEVENAFRVAADLPEGSDARHVESALKTIVAPAMKRFSDKFKYNLDRMRNDYSIFASLADGKQYVINRRAFNILKEVGAMYRDNPHDAAAAMRAILNLSGTEDEIADALITIKHMGNPRIFMGQSAQETSLVLRNMFLDEDGVVDLDKFMSGLEAAQKEGVAAVQDWAYRKVQQGSKDLLPSVDDRLKAIDEAKAAKAAGQTLTRKQEAALLDVVPGWVRKVNSTNNRLQKFVRPFNTFFSNVYMGASPAFAMRNLQQNILQSVMDEGIGVLFTTEKDAIAEMEAWGSLPQMVGYDPRKGIETIYRGAAASEEATITNKLNMMHWSEKFERAYGTRTMHAVQKKFYRDAMKIGRAIPPIDDLVASGMTRESAVALTEFVIRYKGNYDDAVRAFVAANKTGSIDVFRNLSHYDSKMVGKLERLHFDQKLQKALDEATDASDFRNRVDEIFNNWHEAHTNARAKAPPVPGLGADSPEIKAIAEMSDGIADEAIHNAGSYIQANQQANHAYQNAVMWVNSQLNLSAKTKKDKAAYQVLVNKYRDVVSGSRFSATAGMSETLSARGATYAHADRKLWATYWKEMYPDVPFRNMTAKEYHKAAWDWYWENKRKMWTDFREWNAAQSEAFFEEALKLNKNIDTGKFEDARAALELSRQWDTVLREDQIVPLLEAAKANGRMGEYNRLLAYKYGLPSVSSKGVALDENMLLGIVNKARKEFVDAPEVAQRALTNVLEGNVVSVEDIDLLRDVVWLRGDWDDWKKMRNLEQRMETLAKNPAKAVELEDVRTEYFTFMRDTVERVKPVYVDDFAQFADAPPDIVEQAFQHHKKMHFERKPVTPAVVAETAPEAAKAAVPAPKLDQMERWKLIDEGKFIPGVEKRIEEAPFYRANKVTYKANAPRAKKSALGIYFSASEDVAKSYGEDVQKVRLDIKKPFNVSHSTHEEIYAIAKKLGDTDFVKRYGEIIARGETPMLSSYSGSNTLGVPKTIMNKWLDEFDAEKIQRTLKDLGYDAIVDLSGESAEGFFGMNAFEAAVFDPGQIKAFEQTAPEAAKVARKAENFVPHPQPSGSAPFPHMAVAAQDDGVRKLLSEFSEIVTERWGDTEDVFINADIKKAINAWAKIGKVRMGEARTMARGIATAARDFTLLSYGEKRYFDLALAYVFPYQFWYSRTYAHWLQRLVYNPEIIAAYGKYREAMEILHAGAPDWWKYQINSNELLGLDWENPIMLNLEATLNPLNGLTGIDFNDPKKREVWWASMVDDMGKFGPSLWTPINWAVAAALALRDEDEAAALWMGRLVPQTVAVKSVLNLVGARLGKEGLNELDPFINMFQGGMDKHERRRVGRALKMLVDQGKMSQEAMIDAVQSQTGLDWQMGARLADKMRAPGNLMAAFLGVGYRGRNVSDIAIDLYDADKRRLINQKDNLSPDEYQRQWMLLNAKYPFGEAVTMSRLGGIERDEAYAWNVLSRIPPGQKKEILEGVGINYEIVNKFYDMKGLTDKDGKTIMAPADLDNFMNGMVQLGAILALPDDPTKAEWTIASSRYKAMQKDLNRLFGDDIQERISAFFAATSDERNAMRQSDPQLFDALDWQNEIVFKDELLSAYYGGLSQVEKYLTNKMYNEAAKQFGRNIFMVQTEYNNIKDYDEKEAAKYLKQHPELKKYWDWKSEQAVIIGQKLTDAIPNLRTGISARLRDALLQGTLPSVGQEGVREIVENPPELVPAPYNYTWDDWQPLINPSLQNLLMDYVYDDKELTYAAEKQLSRIATKLDIDDSIMLGLIAEAIRNR
jgi:hypothetical protein